MFASNLARALALPGVLVAILAQASPLLVTVDTSALTGVSAIIAFDLTGGPTPGNTVTLSNFATDGTLGSSSTTGTVSGAFPGIVTLDDTITFFNEYSQAETLGTTFSFAFDTTGNAPADPAFPDGFSLFLLDPNNVGPFGPLPLVSTSDPTGADSLLLYNIGEPDPLSVYQSDAVTVSVTGVPEPGTLALALAGLLALPVLRSVRKYSLRR